MKRCLSKISLISLLLTPKLSFAALLDDLNGAGNDANRLGAISILLGNIRDIILSIAIVLSVLMIMVGGLIYITSAGNEEQAKKGKKFLTYSIYGFLLIILARIIITIFVRILGGDYS